MQSFEEQKPIFGKTEQPDSYRNYVEIPVSYIFLEKKKQCLENPTFFLVGTIRGNLEQYSQGGINLPPKPSEPIP